MSSTPYDRQSSFAQYSAENPGEPHSGSSLDAEFNAVKTALDDTQQNLALIQDDDGALKRGSVGKEQFDSSVTIGFGAPSQWASGQIYTADVDTVFYNSIFYIANVTHTSGASFEPAKWDAIADFTLAAVIPDASITSAKLAPGAVTADKIGDGSISAPKIATGAVSTAKIADQNVTTPKIADQSVTSNKLDQTFLLALVPAGVVVPYAGTSAPAGWLFCYGQTVSRSVYPNLFAALGTAYGSGDGSTTFGLPDMRGRVAAGKDDMGGAAASRLTSTYFGASASVLGAVGGLESHTMTLAQLPTGITSANAAQSITVAAAGGRFIAQATVSLSNLAMQTGGNTYPAYSSGGDWSGSTNSLSGSNAISVTSNNTSGNAHNNVQPTIVLNHIIKAH